MGGNICFRCDLRLTGGVVYHKDMVKTDTLYKSLYRERSGSVVECLTRDRRVAGSSLTGVTALWSLSKTHLS